LPPLVGYTFVGNEFSEEKYVVGIDGVITLLDREVFNPYKFLGPSRLKNFKHGLIDFLPAIDFGFFDDEKDLGFEEIAFVDPLNPTLYIRVRTIEGNVYYLKYPPLTECNRKEFYESLLRLHEHWRKFFDKGMKVSVPDDILLSVSKLSIIRALITYQGLHPKYGVKRYAETIHDGFPLTTISLVNCLLEWGFFNEAKEKLIYYIDNFIRENGTFDYYGPALSEYGQLLALIVKFVRYTNEWEVLEITFDKVSRIVNYVLSLVKESKGERPYGLVLGPAEADTRPSHIKYFFSNNLWLCRELLELGKLLLDSENEAFKEYGGSILEECELFLENVIDAIKSCFDEKNKFLPPALEVRPFKTMAQDDFASYTNYCYWPEILSSDLLDEEMINAIVDYREIHGGEILGMTRFMWLVSFTIIVNLG